MPATDDRREQDRLEAEVGHPGDLRDELFAMVQDRSVRQFSDVQVDWLRLMWCVDQYRVREIVPRGMGNLNNDPASRLAAVYRQKGNWFADVLGLIIGNRTNERLAPRSKVEGFSQLHQIDVAWPARRESVLICAETKVTGAPRFARTPERGAMADWTNRRKELKFAATDLKLWRRDRDTSIDHWGSWRTHAEPQTYFLWAARLRRGTIRDGARRGHDDIRRLVTEAQALVESYLDGAGLMAWQENDESTGYEVVPLPRGATIRDLDDVLHLIASEITRIVSTHGGTAPPVERPEVRSVDVDALAEDAAEYRPR